MGRPIKEKFFGNLNYPNVRIPQGISGTGGEKLGSVTLTNTGTHYSAGTTAVVSTPDLFINSNTTATVSLTINSGALGNIATVSVVNAGAGYITTPTITLNTATAQTYTVTTNTTNSITMNSVVGIYTGMQAVGTGINAGATYVTSVVGNVVNLSATNANSNLTGNSIQFIDRGASGQLTAVLAATTNTSLNVLAWAPTKKNSNQVANTTGSAIASDILKQLGARSYRIKNNEGYGRVKLVTRSPQIGECNIIATDRNGNTYYVTKLMAHKAILTRKTQNGANAWLFATGTSAKWILDQGVTAAVGFVNLAAD
jgi:hypothetical protein